MPRTLIPLRAILGVLQIGINSQGYREPDLVMSDSDESGVTYTKVSSPFEDLSNIGSPRDDDHEYLELPGMPEDPYHADDEIVAEDQPYAEDASPTAQSPDYVPESDPEADPEEDDDEDPEEDPVDYPADGGDGEEGSSEDDEDNDMDIEADDDGEEEEHPAPADSIVVALPATDPAPSAKETEPFETDESAATPPPHPTYCVTSKISILAPVPIPAWSGAEVARLLAISTPPSSPLSPWSSPLPQIPSPSLPLSPPSPVLSPAPPPSPIRSLGYECYDPDGKLRPQITSHSLPYYHSLHALPTRISAPSLGRTDEVTLPPRKRLGIALGPRYKVGESLSATAARTAMCPETKVGYGITDSWDEIVETLQGQPVSTDMELGRHMTAFETRMETEARLSQEAWRRSMDASDLARGEVMSLRTTILGQTSEIRELHAVDRRRQAGQVTTLQGQVAALQGKVTALQGQQGPAGGPVQPELPEEAGRNS
ncbi:hypothetical protein Tco_1383229 [Tanacetum coccineum]